MQPNVLKNGRWNLPSVQGGDGGGVFLVFLCLKYNPCQSSTTYLFCFCLIVPYFFLANHRRWFCLQNLSSSSSSSAFWSARNPERN